MKDLLVTHKALGGAYVKRNGCLPHHASRLPFISYQTLNRPFVFPITRNLSSLDFNYCPEMVVHNVIRMWSELNDSLPGLSLTTPMFLDGYIDFDPSLIGPKFSIFNESIQLTRPCDNWYNQCYSSFIYLPEKFRLELDRLAQPVLLTDVKCLDHYLLQEGTKTGVTDKKSTKCLRSHCTPMPNRFKTLNNSDDLFAKVPHTNAAMRNSLKACNTL